MSIELYKLYKDIIENRDDIKDKSIEEKIDFIEDILWNYKMRDKLEVEDFFKMDAWRKIRNELKESLNGK